MTAQQIPEAAQTHLRQFALQAESIQAQMQSFMDGVLFGLGIDVENNDINVDLEKMTFAVTPKVDEPVLDLDALGAKVVEEKKKKD